MLMLIYVRFIPHDTDQKVRNLDVRREASIVAAPSVMDAPQNNGRAFTGERRSSPKLQTLILYNNQPCTYHVRTCQVAPTLRSFERSSDHT